MGAMKCGGVYRGVVINNEDPIGEGRLRVKIPAVFGPNEVTNWIPPIRQRFTVSEDSWSTSSASVGDHGSHSHTTPTVDKEIEFKVPDVGQGVWVMFESGDPTHPLYLGVF